VIIRKRNPDRFSRFSTADACDLQTDRPRYTAVTTGRILATTHSDAAWRCSRSRLLVPGGAAIVHELSGSCVGGLALRVNCSSGVLWQRGLLALLLEWTGRRFIFLGTCTCCAPAWAAAVRSIGHGHGDSSSTCGAAARCSVCTELNSAVSVDTAARQNTFAISVCDHCNGFCCRTTTTVENLQCTALE